MSIQLSPFETNRTTIIQAILSLISGRNNAGGKVTLTPSAGSTTVTAPNISAQGQVYIMPTTAHAAAEVQNGTIWISALGNGSFTITHANNAQADRTFYWTCLGG